MFTFGGEGFLLLGVSFLTFGFFFWLRLGDSNSYVWRLEILTFGG